MTLVPDPQKRILLACLGVVIPAFTGAGDWKLVEETRSEASPVLVRKSVENETGRQVSLTLCLFETGDYTLQVVDQGDEPGARKYANLRDAMEQNGCVAGVNGGFFGTDFKALGAVYKDGKRIAPYVDSNRNGLATGVVWSGAGGIHIVRRQQFQEGPGVKQAIQSGPMLISGGRIVGGLSDSNWRSRSFVLTDWKGNWMIGTSTAVSLAALAEILDSETVFSSLKIDRAINLDGGRSTGFYLRQDNGKVTYIREFSRVRNFLGIVPRSDTE